jgi:hypothetical protein
LLACGEGIAKQRAFWVSGGVIELARMLERYSVVVLEQHSAGESLRVLAKVAG